MSGARPSQLSIELPQHVPRECQRGVVNINQKTGSWKSFELLQQFEQYNRRPALFPFIHAFSQQPHPVHVFQKADGSPYAAEVCKIHSSSFITNASSSDD